MYTKTVCWKWGLITIYKVIPILGLPFDVSHTYLIKFQLCVAISLNVYYFVVMKTCRIIYS